MDMYLVGGAVRDQLLGRNVEERDWVVVGAHPEELVKQGYRQVGKDFPVFLHPESHEEYALARTERKTGHGYTGFSCYAAPDVSLEDDLKRRDLTINAMAMTPEGKLVDPFHGQTDLQHKQLRHVSEAFAEDPVRILRAARFAAQLPGFEVQPDTMALMQGMVKDGEAKHLVPERIWKECEKAMHAVEPCRFFEVLQQTGLLQDLSHSIEIAWQDLKTAAAHSEQATIRFACTWHRGDSDAVAELCQTWRAPKVHTALAILLCKHRDNLLRSPRAASDVLSTLQQCDAFRRPKRFDSLLIAAKACSSEPTPHIQSFWQGALASCEEIDMATITQAPKDHSIQRAVQQARTAKIDAFLKNH